MTRTAKIIAGVLAAAVLLAAGPLVYSKWYAGPRQRLLGELESQWSAIERLEDALDEGIKVRERLRTVGARTLGDKLDVAEHRFRTGLNAIAAESGLSEIRVDNQSPSPVRNAAGSQARLEGRLGRALRQQVDFQVIRGSVRGIGSLDQAMRAIAAVSAQDWAHRVDGFSLQPVGQERERFELKLAVSTLFVPDLAPKDLPEPPRIALSDDAHLRWRPVVEKNVFRLPPAPPPAAQVAEAAAPAPPPSPGAPERPPYDDWKLTGLIQTTEGCEALLVNTRTSEATVVPTGGAVAGVVFEAGSGERAVFRIGEQRYEVLNGETLERRRPLE